MKNKPTISYDVYLEKKQKIIKELSKDTNKELLELLSEILHYEFKNLRSISDSFVFEINAAPILPKFNRLAVISDIHGNYEGLSAALHDSQEQNCDQIICLGDLVEGGKDNVKVIDFIKQDAIPCVQGIVDPKIWTIG